jgi:hypothetical protein
VQRKSHAVLRIASDVELAHTMKTTTTVLLGALLVLAGSSGGGTVVPSLDEDGSQALGTHKAASSLRIGVAVAVARRLRGNARM